MAAKKSQPVKKSHRSIQLLVLSGGLNVALFAFLAYTWVKERPPIPYYVLKPAEVSKAAAVTVPGNGELLRGFKEMSLVQLIAKLNNKQPVESGYAQRDFALGCLTSFHHFNLERALIGLQQPQQPRRLVLGNGQEMTLFPGLSEVHFQAIIFYARTEQWPFTSEGLFLKLQGSEFQNEPSLHEAFFLTPEFQTVETLFSRSAIPLSKKQLLTMLKEGDWKMLHSFTEQQKMSQDLSAEKRQAFLLDYIAHQSTSAAYLLLQQDPEFAVKKLDDLMVITMLKVLTTKTPEAEKFALEMLSSPRSDAVWQQASLRLFDFAGGTPPANPNRAEALSTFSPKSIATKKAPLAIAKTQPVKAAPAVKVLQPKKELAQAAKPASKPVSKKEMVYVVQEGDSLWKISKRFKVDVDQIKKKNGLSSDSLKIGTPLRIPA